MNTKGMIVAIVTAMLVMTMFASSAMAAITVDGDPSDWSPADKLCDDDDFWGSTPYVVGCTGYNITSLWACIEDGVLYARLDVVGTAGDADGDGDDTTDNVVSGADWPGVGVGAPTCAREQYFVEIDADNGGSSVDYVLTYCLGDSRLEDSVGTISGATTSAAHAGSTVEFSVVIDSYCDVDLTGYCVSGWADTQEIGHEDSVGPVCRTDEPPTVDCSFTTISCGQGMLSGTGSSDDGTIVEYAWDFGDDGTYDAYGETVLYDIIGTQDVRLMVTDNLGQTANCTLSVTLTSGPIADAKADGSDGPVQLPQGGKLVTFCGDESDHPDAANGAYIASYHWTILGVDYSTTDRNECFDVFIDETTTAYLKVVDNFGCEHIDTVTLRVPLYKPPSDVPILTPTGMVVLIGMLCIVGAGRILTKGRRS